MKKIYRIEELLWNIFVAVLVYLFIPVSLLTIPNINHDILSRGCVVFINMVYVFVSSLIYTKKNGFSWYYPVIIGITFIPCCILLYDDTTAIYSIFYIVVGLLSSLICYKYKKL